jgi:predicted short-subunit dehydrogenase-like oxidoreductase (DUF2520 family)
MAFILRYAAPVRRNNQKDTKAIVARKLSLAFVGAGKLAMCLVPALSSAGYIITEIAARNNAGSLKRARVLARRVGAKAVPLGNAALHADAVWLAVSDREILSVAASIAHQLKPPTKLSKTHHVDRRLPAQPHPLRFAFHSSGALSSDELTDLREVGVAVASVHPLMTFASGTTPSLAGVPFAIEGDITAVKTAQAIVLGLGGFSFKFAARRKAAYHAWATLASPLLLAYLATLEKAARAAGIDRENARRMSLPILRQTLANYSRMGSAKPFTGPFVRGDVETVEKHLTMLDRQPRAVYLALARAALERLPVRNRKQFRRLLDNV